MKLRVTKCESPSGGNLGTDTTKRDGHYVQVGQHGGTVEECIGALLNNQFHQGEFFKPGETVDVEEHFGDYIGRYRINSDGVLVKLPSPPTVTTGGKQNEFVPCHDCGTQVMPLCSKCGEGN